MSNVVVVLVALAAGTVLFSSRLKASTNWQATVTPLASIIGSGFLVSVPLLAEEVGNFLLRGFEVDNPELASVVATVILVALGGLGLVRGLGMVEKVETYTVGINLTIIAALLAGLLWHSGAELAAGTWRALPSSPPMGWRSVQTLLGLLIVVQGFETSRFMGDEYNAETRIKRATCGTVAGTFCCSSA